MFDTLAILSTFLIPCMDPFLSLNLTIVNIIFWQYYNVINSNFELIKFLDLNRRNKSKSHIFLNDFKHFYVIE